MHTDDCVMRCLGCYAHLRRNFRDALENRMLRKVYDAACQGTVSGFKQRLDAE